MVVFPPVFGITTPSGARIWVRLLNLDCLIWCNLTGTEGDLAHLFLQTGRFRPIDSPEDDPFGNLYQRMLFPRDLEDFRVGPPAVALRTDDLVGAYVVLIMSICLVLCERKPGSRLNWLTNYDNSLNFRRERLHEVVDHLAFDLLPHLRTSEPTNGVIGSLGSQTAQFLGAWVGSQLREDYTTKDRWQQLRDMRYGQQLAQVLRYCLELAPDSPDNWFRLGAVACFLQDGTTAARAFRRAAEKAPGCPYIKWSGALVFVENASTEVRSSNGLARELSWCRLAAHAACALAVGGDWEANAIRKQLDSHAALSGEREERTTKTVVIKVVEGLIESFGKGPSGNDRSLSWP